MNDPKLTGPIKAAGPRLPLVSPDGQPPVFRITRPVHELLAAFPQASLLPHLFPDNYDPCRGMFVELLGRMTLQLKNTITPISSGLPRGKLVEARPAHSQYLCLRIQDGGNKYE